LQTSPLGRRQVLGRIGAAAAALAIAPAFPARGGGGSPIYQQIWDADQSASGIPAIGPEESGNPVQGFVRVDEPAGTDPEHRLFAQVLIPGHKRRTYDLCKALFDNYRLDQSKPEDNRPEEARETLALLAAVAESPPMARARAQLENERNRIYSHDAWQELIFDVWFRQYDDGRNRDLSGFEHVAVGEQKAGAVNGHHFWYKYYLDDWAAFSGEDDIDYEGPRYDGPHRREGRLSGSGREVPEVVTLAYRWDAFEFESRQRRSLHNPIGGFWVGCSIEGLMALGTIRFFQRGRIETTINGARYEMRSTAAPTARACARSFRAFWAWRDTDRSCRACRRAASDQSCKPVLVEGIA
jgi:hypothetical protein